MEARSFRRRGADARGSAARRAARASPAKPARAAAKPVSKVRDASRASHRTGRPGRSAEKGKGKGPERPKPRQFDEVRPPREQREKEADPDSPFAKLAALKEQLKK